MCFRAWVCALMCARAVNSLCVYAAEIGERWTDNPALSASCRPRCMPTVALFVCGRCFFALVAGTSSPSTPDVSHQQDHPDRKHSFAAVDRRVLQRIGSATMDMRAATALDTDADAGAPAAPGPAGDHTALPARKVCHHGATSNTLSRGEEAGKSTPSPHPMHTRVFAEPPSLLRVLFVCATQPQQATQQQRHANVVRCVHCCKHCVNTCLHMHEGPTALFRLSRHRRM
jgi:hypothetical protein